ncbi:MAG: YbaB/EbfC family nucleoid-associated protein [Deltaproteobacteria bacterium]|nr:YbaB/EbfC family nucleoid-associated protein [Deltaproteobacteria bacterium]
MPNMGNLLKKAQRLQEQMAKLQEELSEKTVETSTVIATGKQEIASIKIDPEVINQEDIEMLEDLVLAAVNDALFQAKQMVSEEMTKLTGGVNIPGLM